MPDLLRGAADVEPTATAGESGRCPVRQPSGHLCGAETVISMLVGCVHEHLRVVGACQFCVEILATGRAACIPCRQVDGHECEVVVLKEVAVRNDPDRSPESGGPCRSAVRDRRTAPRHLPVSNAPRPDCGGR